MKKTITTKEIAKLANVSVGTVDRVLHNRGQVSEKTKHKILQIIESGNYQPNLFARNLALNKTYTIVSLIPSFKANEYWEAPSLGMAKAVSELNQFGLSLNGLEYDPNNPSSFLETGMKILKLKPDAVILAPVFKNEMKILAKYYQTANIPFVFIDSNIAELPALTFIGQDSFQSGCLAAKLLNFGSTPGSEFCIVSLVGKRTNNIVSRRIQGFENYFLENKLNVPITRFEGSNDTLNTFYDYINQRDASGINVFVSNSKINLVASKLDKIRKSRKIKLLGYDLIKANRMCLLNGNIDFIIDQQAQLQGYQGIQLIYQHLILKQKLNRINFMPIDIVTKENLMYCSGNFSYTL